MDLEASDPGAELRAARADLNDATTTLSGIGARALRLVPIVRQNLDSLEVTARSLIPVLSAAERMHSVLEEMTEEGLIADGAVDIGAIDELGTALDDVVAAIESADQALDRKLSGWLLPPIWTGIADLATTVDDFTGTARRGAALIDRLPAMLGFDTNRTYLVILMNSAELRGAGGIPSGLGTIRFVDGQIHLGRFHYYATIAGRSPQETVDAPPEFRRRFGRYGADTPLWINVTMSPDIPDVARVASNLYQLATGTATDGAIIVDPRGLAALVEPTADIELAGQTMAAGNLPDYVFSGAYQDFSDQTARRRALVEVGRAVFTAALEGSVASPERLRAAAAATAGGHMRFVSFAEDEARALASVGASGDLESPVGDAVLVTVQNLGADKLDFWARRSIEHHCQVPEPPDAGRCHTKVTLRNAAPPGLPAYVDPSNRRVMKRFVEIYIPEQSTLEGVDLDGNRVAIRSEIQAGFEAVGATVDLAANTETTLTAVYSLPPDDGYELIVIPQPLAVDGRIDISVALPEDWVATGPGGHAGGVDLHGTFEEGLRVEAGPPHRSGIGAAWEWFSRLLRRPVFELDAGP